MPVPIVGLLLQLLMPCYFQARNSHFPRPGLCDCTIQGVSGDASSPQLLGHSGLNPLSPIALLLSCAQSTSKAGTLFDLLHITQLHVEP